MWNPATVAGQELSWSREVKIPYREYDSLYKRFNPVEFDAEAWMRLLQQSGFRYAVYVTKHHDGFAMWDTKTTAYGVMNTPFHRDVLGEIAIACRKAGFPLCLYYSIADLHQPDCIGSNHANGVYLGPPGSTLPPGEKPSFERYVRYMKAQLRELTEKYGPVLAWWFDGGWMREWTYERGVDLLKFMRSLQADTLVDQRVGCAYNGPVYMPTWFPTDVDYVGDYAVLEVDLPRFNRKIPWEYTTPANGRSYDWTPGPYQEPETWIDNLVKSACGDGNYLLGVTPPQSGRFDPALVDKLRESSVWLERYGASVFDTRGGPYQRTNVYGTTCQGQANLPAYLRSDADNSDAACSARGRGALVHAEWRRRAGVAERHCGRGEHQPERHGVSLHHRSIGSGSPGGGDHSLWRDARESQCDRALLEC